MGYNKYLSSLEELNLDSYPEEIKELFFDFITTVPYIKNLISENRPYAKDCPKDKEGKIIVDLTNPPIIEDTDYFRPTALHFQKYGCITKLRPNSNPNSEFGKWAREEIRRCYLGYVRESDGAWVPGDMYFFLNYCPIMKVKRLKGKRGIRVVDFPDFLEGQWLRFVYILMARDNAKHGSELAKRGAGKAHPYDLIVYTPSGPKLWGTIQIGDILFGDDGKETRVVDIPFNDETDVYKLTLKDGRVVEASGEHLWKVKVHGRKNILILSTREILAIYKRTRLISLGLPSGIEYTVSIPRNDGVDWDEYPTLIDPYTFGLLLGDGCFRVPNSKNKTYYSCYDSDFAEIKLYIPYNYFKYNNTKYGYTLKIPDFGNILKLYGLFMRKSEDKFIPKEFIFNSRRVRLELLKGMIDSVGYIGSSGRYEITLSSKKLIEDLLFLCRSLGYNCSYTTKKTVYKKDGIHIPCLPCYRLLIYTDDIICKLTRKISNLHSTNYANSYEQLTSITNIEYVGKKLCKCVTVDNSSHCYLIGDFITTHNSFSMASVLAKRFLLGELDETTGLPSKGVESFVASYYKTYLNDDGILNKFEKYIDFCAEFTLFPRKRLASSLDKMKWTSGYKEGPLGAEIKKGSGNEVIGISVKDSPGKLRGKRGAFIGLEEFGSFPNLIELYSTLRPSMEDGDIVFGMIYAAGTAGDKDSDFSAAQKIMYSPRAFNMLPIQNVYDKVGLGKLEFVYFYPAYINRNGCYNKDGVSDVTKAILEVLINRYNVKYNTTDSTLITKTIAEHPIVPQEAILRTSGNLFPSSLINERLNELDANPNIYDDVYVGELIYTGKGLVEYRPSNDVPIRVYPTDDNKEKGAIEFYEMPLKNREGRVFPNRYIAGYDPVDDDVSQTSSLTSVFVLDLLTDRIVAEYTGRLLYADDNFEILKRLCLFYNAKCMYEAHPYDLLVRLPDGSTKLWGDVKVGDKLLTPEGGTTSVINIPIDGEDNIYRVTLADGRTVEASSDHIWMVHKLGRKNYSTFTTKEMINIGVKTKSALNRFSLPDCSSISYSYKETPIDPYTFGLLLAEGAFTKFSLSKVRKKVRKEILISSSKEDMEFYKTKIPYPIKYIGNKGYSWHLYIDNIDIILKDLGLLGHDSSTKFIPNIYLYNDENSRLLLLMGLMDGDGCANTGGAGVFRTTSLLLSTDIKILCRSLGIKCVDYKPREARFGINKYGKLFLWKTAYGVAITAEVPIFSLPRKVSKQYIYHPYSKGSKARGILHRTSIVSIDYVGKKKCKCVTVDREDGLYLIGDYIVTHNCNKKGVYSYLKRVGGLPILAETPEYLKELNIIKEIGYGNKAVGVNATAAVNAFADRLTKEWLIAKVPVLIKDENGLLSEVELPRLYTIKNRAFLQECAAYNPLGNFDRIRAFGMLMIYREAMVIMYLGDTSKSIDDTIDSTAPENDEFFTENFDGRFKD